MAKNKIIKIKQFNLNIDIDFTETFKKPEIMLNVFSDLDFLNYSYSSGSKVGAYTTGSLSVDGTNEIIINLYEGMLDLVTVAHEATHAAFFIYKGLPSANGFNTDEVKINFSNETIANLIGEITEEVVFVIKKNYKNHNIL